MAHPTSWDIFSLSFQLMKSWISQIHLSKLQLIEHIMYKSSNYYIFLPWRSSFSGVLINQIEYTSGNVSISKGNDQVTESLR